MGQNNTINNKNIFGLFPEYNLEQHSVAKKETKLKVISTENDSIEISDKKGKSKKGKIIFGSTLATTIIGSGIAGLLFIKGVNKGSTKKWSELAEKLSKDIQESSKIQTQDLMTKSIITCKKTVKKMLKK